MKLNYQQIKDVTLGAAYIEQLNGKTAFHRFTKAQEELYKSVELGFYNKSFANSCITLEFETNSTSLFLKTHVIPRSSRKFFSHDIFVDNKLCGLLKGKFEDDENIIDGKIVEERFLLGEDKTIKNVRIHLPWSCSSDIIELSLDDGASLNPIKKSQKMIFYGDSITQGYDAEYTSNSYASRVSMELNVEARNKGIGGEIFRPELAILKDEDFAPDIITVAYGTNDWFAGIPIETFENRVKIFLKKLTINHPNAKIFVITPIWRADYQNHSTFGSFNEIKNCLSKIAQRYATVTVIDGFDFVPHDCKLFSDLYLHPNDAGFKYYSESLIAEMKKYI